MIKRFSVEAAKDYDYWKKGNKKIVSKINDLLEDIDKNPYTGLGHPKPLRGDLSGYYRRIIDKKNRLVYRIINEEIIHIIRCKGHYDDK